MEEPLRREFRTASEMKVGASSENSRGQRVAIVDLIGRDAKPMLDKGKVTVGWAAQEVQRVVNVTLGVLQGSILGPGLWNASYDGLLRLTLPEDARLVGYAGDQVALATGRSVEQAELKLGTVMRKEREWMASLGFTH